MLLLDWRSGKISRTPALAAIEETLPCRSAEAVHFRPDSRLLSVTRMRGAAIMPHYFLWKPETASIELLAQFPRDVQRFCAIDPH